MRSSLITRRLLVAGLLIGLVAGITTMPAQAVTQGKRLREFPLPNRTTPFGITAGPDGALWFTERSSNRIGRITTTGVITEYTIPTANSGPQAITVGPDGALWFTELQGD